jgi:hypothetical protein
MRWFLVTMVQLCLGGVAAAQETQLLCPAPGTVLKTTSGSELSFGQRDDFVCNFTDLRGQTRARWGVFWSSDSAVVKQAGNQLRGLWPLKVGNATQITRDGPDGARFFSYRVAARERITVPAGSFDTFLFEEHETTQGGAYSLVSRLWYAPEFGYLVKFGFEAKSGMPPSALRNWEATAVIPPGSSASRTAGATPPVMVSGPVAHKCPQPGTVVRNSLGGLNHFREADADGMTCRFTAANGQDHWRWGGFFSVGQLQKERGGELARLWPLEVGKSIDVVWSEQGRRWDYTYTVLRREPLNVGGTTFDTFVVEHRDSSHGDAYLAYTRFWYAPVVGAYIKYEFQLVNGTIGTLPKNWVATEVKLPSS